MCRSQSPYSVFQVYTMSNESKLIIFEPSKEPRTVILHVNQQPIDGRKPIFDEHGNPSTDYRLLFDETEKAADSFDREKIKTYINNWQTQDQALLTPKQANKAAKRERLRERKKLDKKKKKMSIVNCAFDRSPLINAKDIEEEREIVKAMKAKQFSIKKILNIKPNKSINLNTNFNPVSNKKIELNSRKAPDVVILSDSNSNESDDESDEDSDHIRLNINNSVQRNRNARNFADDTSYNNWSTFVTNDALARRNRKKVEVVDICESSDSDVECIPVDEVVESISDSDEEVDLSANQSYNTSARDGDDENEENDPAIKSVDDEVATLSSLVDSFVSKYIQNVIPSLCQGQMDLESQLNPETDLLSKSIDSGYTPEVDLSSKSIDSEPPPDVQNCAASTKTSRRKKNRKRVTFNESIIECQDDKPVESIDVDTSEVRIDEMVPSPETAFMYNFDSLPSPDYSPAAQIDNVKAIHETKVEDLDEYINNQVLNQKSSLVQPRSNDPRNSYPSSKSCNTPYVAEECPQLAEKFDQMSQRIANSQKQDDEVEPSPQTVPSSSTPMATGQVKNSFQKRPHQFDTSGPSNVCKNARLQSNQESSNVADSQSVTAEQFISTIGSVNRIRGKPSRGNQNYSNRPFQNRYNRGNQNYQYQGQFGYRGRNYRNYQGPGQFDHTSQNHSVESTDDTGEYENHQQPEDENEQMIEESQTAQRSMQPYNLRNPKFPNQRYQSRQYRWQRNKNAAQCYHEDDKVKGEDFVYEENAANYQPQHRFEGGQFMEYEEEKFHPKPQQRFEGGQCLAYEEEKFQPNQWQRGRPYKRFQRRQPQFTPNTQSQVDNYQEAFHDQSFPTKHEERAYQPNHAPNRRFPRGQYGPNRGSFQPQLNHRMPRFGNQARFQRSPGPAGPRFPANRLQRFQSPAQRNQTLQPIRTVQRIESTQATETPKQTSASVQEESLFTRRTGDKFKYKANIDDFQDCVVQKRCKDFDVNSNEPPVEKYEKDVLKKLHSDDMETSSKEFFTWESDKTFDYVAIPVNDPIDSHVAPWNRGDTDSVGDELMAISRRSFIANCRQ